MNDASNMNWIASPILAQRDIELSSINVSYDQAEMKTVFTIHTTDGTIGVFRIDALSLAEAAANNSVRQLIEPHFHTVEFTNGKPTLSEIQPAVEDEDRGIPEETPEADAEPRPVSEIEDPSRSTEATPDAPGPEPGLGQPTE